LRKEAENRHFGRYSDAKTAVYPFKVIQGYWFRYQPKPRVHIPISDQYQLWSFLAPFRRYGGL